MVDTTLENSDERRGEKSNSSAFVMRNPVRERLIIERRKSAFEWEIVAHPKNDIASAMACLSVMRIKEGKKKYQGELRLVREVREIIDA